MKFNGSFGRIIIAAWLLLLGMMLLLFLFPKLASWIPYIELIRPILISLTLVSALYGVTWIYRQGMKSTKKR